MQVLYSSSSLAEGASGESSSSSFAVWGSHFNEIELQAWEWSPMLIILVSCMRATSSEAGVDLLPGDCITSCLLEFGEGINDLFSNELLDDLEGDKGGALSLSIKS